MMLTLGQILRDISADSAAAFFLDLALKSTLILACGIVVASAAARSSAAVRHRLWCLTFAALLMLPGLSTIVPQWKLAVLPAASTERGKPAEGLTPPAAVPSSERYEAANDGGERHARRTNASEVAVHGSSFVERHAAGSGQTAPAPAPVPSKTGTSRVSWVVVAWSCGSLVVLFPLIVSLIYHRVLASRATVVSDSERIRLLESLSDSLKLHRRIRLLEIPRALIPMTWGVFRPVVLFPSDWKQWSRGTREFALLHELAHVKRYDVAFQLLGRIVCSLYWFHPLSWYALRKLRMERELACDDCVVSAAGHPNDYARQLVRIARSCKSTALASAVAMAQTSDLEQRVRSLLDAARSHVPMSRRKGLSLAIMAFVLVTGIAAMRLGVSANPTTTAEATPNQQADRFRYEGTVVDREGRPVEGARVFHVFWIPGGLPDETTKPNAITTASGGFEFSKTLDLPGRDRAAAFATLVVQAPGFGISETPSYHFETTGTLQEFMATHDFVVEQIANAATIQLQPQLPLKGRILTVDGEPVPNATVQIDRVWKAKGTLDAWEADAKQSNADFYQLRNKHRLTTLNGRQLQSIIQSVQTDGDGHFKLEGIAVDRIVKLLVSGPGIAATELHARTRTGETLRFGEQGRPMIRCYSNGFSHVVGPSRILAGRIIDGDTGKPLAGVRVAAGSQSSQFGAGKYWLATTTDDDGNYQLDGLSPSQWELITVEAARDQGYLPAASYRQVKPERSVDTHDVKLRKGRWLRGRALDRDTGEPLTGFVRFFSDAENPALSRFPDFRHFMSGLETTTDADGQFTISVPPGPGIICFTPYNDSQYRRGMGAESISIKTAGGQGDVRIYNTAPGRLISTNEVLLQQVDVKADGENPAIELAPEAGRVVRGRIVDSSGQPVSDCLVNGTFPGRSLWSRSEKPVFRVRGVYSDTKQDLYVYCAERNLAGHALITTDDREPVVALAPAGSVTGRLINAEGGPISTLLVGDGIPSGNDVKSDEEGRFTVHGLIPGRTYSLQTGTRGQRVFSDLDVKAGEVKDIGTVTLQPDSISSPGAGSEVLMPSELKKSKPKEAKKS